MARTCDLCQSPHLARGFCRFHYNQWKRRGDPLAPRRKAPNGAVLAWLRSIAAMDDWPDECMVNDLSTSDDYAQVMIDGVGRRGTHVLMELLGTPRPDAAHEILHSCDNPPCCNPRHIRWGTHRENVHDMWDKGRGFTPFGS